jgi:hypothetical protein
MSERESAAGGNRLRRLVRLAEEACAQGVDNRIPKHTQGRWSASTITAPRSIPHLAMLSRPKSTAVAGYGRWTPLPLSHSASPRQQLLQYIAVQPAYTTACPTSPWLHEHKLTTSTHLFIALDNLPVVHLCATNAIVATQLRPLTMNRSTKVESVVRVLPKVSISGRRETIPPTSASESLRQVASSISLSGCFHYSYKR